MKLKDAKLNIGDIIKLININQEFFCDSDGDICWPESKREISYREYKIYEDEEVEIVPAKQKPISGDEALIYSEVNADMKPDEVWDIAWNKSEKNTHLYYNELMELTCDFRMNALNCSDEDYSEHIETYVSRFGEIVDKLEEVRK